MQHRQDHELVIEDDVGNDVGRISNDEFAGLIDPAGTAQIWIIGETLDRSADGGPYPIGRHKVVLRDVSVRLVEVFKRDRAPNYLHKELGFARRRPR
jgi:hypothetical protein